MKYVIIVALGVLVIFEYACAVVSKRDRQAEELLERYKRSKENEHGADDTI